MIKLSIETTISIFAIMPPVKKFKNEMQKAQIQKISLTRHKCAVCGRTEKDDPNLEFRYCSKCAGNMEYCMDHLYTHKHVTEEELKDSK